MFDVNALGIPASFIRNVIRASDNVAFLMQELRLSVANFAALDQFVNP